MSKKSFLRRDVGLYITEDWKLSPNNRHAIGARLLFNPDLVPYWWVRAGHTVSMTPGEKYLAFTERKGWRELYLLKVGPVRCDGIPLDVLRRINKAVVLPAHFKAKELRDLGRSDEDMLLQAFLEARDVIAAVRRSEHQRATDRLLAAKAAVEDSLDYVQTLGVEI